MSDIHGCLSAFNNALELVLPHLDEPNTVLMLMGDYVHGGGEDRGVLDRITGLQKEYGRDKVIALMGNHEEWVCEGECELDGYASEENDREYIKWMRGLPRYHKDGKTIFVHAGVDEEAQEYWELGTMDYIFTGKFPAETGHFYEDYKIVAGHVPTTSLAHDPDFNGIYHDGASHYYIDAHTKFSGSVNVLKVDTDKQKYYEITASGEKPVMPYV